MLYLDMVCANKKVKNNFYFLLHRAAEHRGSCTLYPDVTKSTDTTAGCDGHDGHSSFIPCMYHLHADHLRLALDDSLIVF
jgi:hypothetical protein